MYGHPISMHSFFLQDSLLQLLELKLQKVHICPKFLKMGKMDLITIIDYTGTLVFAISGVMAGVDRKFDFFGVFILGFVTALGRGTIRDVLIGSTPVGWMQNEIYILIVSIAVVICFFAKNLILKLDQAFHEAQKNDLPVLLVYLR